MASGGLALPLRFRVSLTQAAPVLAVFEGRRIWLPVAWVDAGASLDIFGVRGFPPFENREGWGSLCRDGAKVGNQPVGDCDSRMGMPEMFCRPSGTRFLFLGAYPGLTSWAIICRPSGAVSQFPFWESVPFFLSIFLPLSFLSCRIERLGGIREFSHGCCLLLS